MNDELDILMFLSEQVHNEQVRRNIKKLHKTGKIFDDKGKEVEIRNTVNYKRVIE